MRRNLHNLNSVVLGIDDFPPSARLGKLALGLHFIGSVGWLLKSSIFALIVILLGACTSSDPSTDVNAEGYAGYKAATYYWAEPGYTCTPPGSSTPIPSYRGSLQVLDDGSAIVIGDECSDSVEHVDAKDVQASLDQSFVAYKDGLYEASGTPLRGDEPDRLYAFAWCKALNTSLDFILRAGRTPTVREVNVIYRKDGVIVPLFKIPVNVTIQNNWRFYTSMANPSPFTTAVNFTPRPDHLYPGVVWVQKEGEVETLSLLCRLLFF